MEPPAAALPGAAPAANGVEIENGRTMADNRMKPNLAAGRPAEADSRKGEDLYRTLARNFPGGVVGIFDRGLRCEIIDGTLLATLGLEKTQMEGRTIQEAFPAEFGAALEPHFRCTLSGKPAVFAVAYQGLDLEIQTHPLADEAGIVSRIMLVATDATERNRLQRCLEANEERLRLALEAINDGIYDWNLSTGRTELSASYYRLLGYAPGEIELNYESWRQLLHPDDLARVEETHRKSLHGGVSSYSLEFRIRRKNGDYAWFLGRGDTVKRGADGRPLRLIGTVTDITARKHAEERLRLALDAVNDGIWDWELSKDRAYWSPSYYRLLGYEPGEIENGYEACLQIIHPDDRPRVEATHKACLDHKDAPDDVEFRMRRKSGDYAWFLGRGGVVERGADGRPLRLMGTVSDITGRKKAEERLRLAMEAAEEGIWDWDTSTDRAYWSPSYYRLLGYEPGEFDNSYENWRRMIHPDDLARVEEAHRAIFEREKASSYSLEFRMRRKNGDYAWFLGRGDAAERGAGGRPLRVVGTISDITARKQAEKRLLESEERFRRLAENATDMIYRMSLPDGRYEYVSPAAAEIFGYPPEEFYARPKLITDLLPPQWTAYFEAEWQKLLQGDAPRTYEYQIVHPTAGLRWLNQRHVVLRDAAGRPTAIEGIVTDVTASRETEAQLRESEQRLSLAMEAADDGLWDYRPKTGRGFISPGYYRMLGYAPGEFEPDYDTLARMIHPEDLGRVESAINECLNGEQPGYAVEFRMAAKSGRLIWVRSKGKAVERDQDGRALRLIGTISDITPRKLAEEALSESEEKLRQFLEHSPVPMAISDADGTIEYINRSFTRILGYELTDIPVVEEWLRRAYPDEAYRRQAVARWEKTIITPAQEDRLVVSSEETVYKVACKDGGTRFLDIQGALIRGKLFVVLNDITARRQAEQTLRMTQLAVDRVRDGVYWVEPDSRFLYVNDAACQSLGYSRDELLGLSVQEINPEFPPEAWAVYWESLREKKSIVLESRQRRRDGTVFPVEISANLITYRDREYDVAFVRDISERKRDEEKLRDSLAEKEVLLREVHHRVKNNLQVVSSLLELQSKSAQDPSVRQMFKESLQRVKSIALVHQHLHQSEDIARIDLAKYIDGLSRNLHMAYLGAGETVAIRRRLDSVATSIDTAVPCGLIVNELVVNALKHAFPGGRGGEVRIRLEGADDQTLVLEVADDGVGWPPEMKSQQFDSLGLTLVEVLTRQLRGRLEILRGNGAAVRITFKNVLPPGRRPVLPPR